MKNFQIPSATDQGNNLLEQLEFIFERAQDAVNDIVPTGREGALVATKLQEAYLFAHQAICHAHKRALPSPTTSAESPA